MSVTIITPDATVVVTTGQPTLEEAKKLVGGWIEIVTIELNGEETQCVCNEEGLLIGLPWNPLVTFVLNGKVNMGPGAVGTWIFLTGKDKFT